MSNHPHRRPRPKRRPIGRATIDRAAAINSATRGCTCHFEIRTIRHEQGIPRVSIAHDADCPALVGRGAS